MVAEPAYNAEWLLSYDSQSGYSFDRATIALSGGGAIPSGEVLKEVSAGTWGPLVVGDTDVSAMTLGVLLDSITVPAGGSLADQVVLTRAAQVRDTITQSSADADADVYTTLAGFGIVVRTELAVDLDSTPA